jgi:hypothetical protein
LRTSVKLPHEDDVYHNSEGNVDIGINRDDSVLGRSEATPRIFYLNQNGTSGLSNLPRSRAFLAE